MDAEYSDELDRVQSLLTRLEAAVTTVAAGSASGGGGGGGGGSALRAANAAADKLLLECERGLSSLGALKRNSKPSRKAAIAEDMARVKAGVERARKALKDANYAELVGGRRAAAEAEGREKMVRTTQAAVSGTAKLEAGLGLLTETEDIGVSVIDNMTQQREFVPSAGRASVRSACSSGGYGAAARTHSGCHSPRFAPPAPARPPERAARPPRLSPPSRPACAQASSSSRRATRRATFPRSPSRQRALCAASRRAPSPTSSSSAPPRCFFSSPSAAWSRSSLRRRTSIDGRERSGSFAAILPKTLKTLSECTTRFNNVVARFEKNLQQSVTPPENLPSQSSVALKRNCSALPGAGCTQLPSATRPRTDCA